MFCWLLFGDSGFAQSPPASAPTATPASTSTSTEVSYPNLSYRGYLQMQWDQGALGAPAPEARFPSGNGVLSFPARDHILSRRFRNTLELKLDPQWTVLTEFNSDLGKGDFQMLDLRLDHKFSPSWKVSAGRFKVPFGWEGLRSSRTTNTVERSDMTVVLYPERDVGASVTYRNGAAEVTLGSFLGQPRGVGSSNGQFDTIGRATLAISPDLKVGVSGHLGSFRLNGTTEDLPVRRWGADLQWSRGAWGFEAETIWSDGWNLASQESSRAFGVSGTVIHRLAEPLDLVVSYDRFDPNLDSSSSTLANSAETARDRKVVGLTYHFDRQKTHRLMLNYEWKDSLEGAAFHREGLRMRYQIAW